MHRIDPMRDWLLTHAPVITGVGAALLASTGDCVLLGRDRRATKLVVKAIRETFVGLERAGIAVTSRSLRQIFVRASRFIGVTYWQRQLLGPVGTLALAPHIRETRHTELAALVRSVMRAAGSTPTLQRLPGGER